MSDHLATLGIIETATSGEVQVELRGPLDVNDLIDIERVWHPARLDITSQLLAAKADPALWPQSWHWDWHGKVAELNLLATTVYGIWSADGPQAVMMLKSAPYEARLMPDTGKPIVYLSFLEVAPWNWTVTPIGQMPRYKGLGTQMLRAAVGFSRREEFKGRLGLHSLPQSVTFYERHGFENLGPDIIKEGLAYMEISAARAAATFGQSGEAS